MGTKEFHFTPQDLLQLLVHYTDGAVPLNGEVKEFCVHPYLHRKIGLSVQSEEWDRKDPLFIGYDGKRIASWAKGDSEQSWREMNETPTRQ